MTKYDRTAYTFTKIFKGFYCQVCGQEFADKEPKILRSQAGEFYEEKEFKICDDCFNSLRPKALNTYHTNRDSITFPDIDNTLAFLKNAKKHEALRVQEGYSTRTTQPPHRQSPSG